MAEVKVKITAQNEVRTGLQQALQETQKFSQQAKQAVSQTMTINPFEGDDRLGPLRDLQRQARELRELARAPIEPAATPNAGQGAELTTRQSGRAAAAIRGLASDLAAAQSPAQAFEAVLNRVGQAIGGLTAVVVGLAIGKAIAGQIDQITAAIDSFKSRLPSIANDIKNLGSADNFSSAIAGFKRLSEAADETARKAKELRDNPLTAGANFLTRVTTGNDGISFLEDQARQLRSAAAQQLRVSAGGQLRQQQDLLGVAGDQDAEKSLTQQFERENQINELIRERAEARERGDAAVVENLSRAIELTRERFAVEDQIAAKRKEAAAERQERNFASSAAQQRAANEDRGRSLEEKLARERQALADLDQFGGAGVELLREQTLGRILTLEEAITAERERQEQQAKQKERAAALERERQIAEEKQKQQQQKSAQEAVSNLRRIGQTPEERQESINKDASRLLAEAGSLQPGDFAGAQDIASRAARIAGELSGLESKNTVGGASDLQRVGLASREFFGSVDDKTTKAVDRVGSFVSKVVEILQNSDGLYIERN